jgi:hypothetical protein
MILCPPLHAPLLLVLQSPIAVSLLLGMIADKKNVFEDEYV